MLGNYMPFQSLVRPSTVPDTLNQEVGGCLVRLLSHVLNSIPLFSGMSESHNSGDASSAPGSVQDPWYAFYRGDRQSQRHVCRIAF